MAKLDAVKEESYYSESYDQQDVMMTESVINTPINKTPMNVTKPKKTIRKEGILEFHHQQYLKLKEKSKLPPDYEEIQSIIAYMSNRRIKCFKYNYSLDPEAQVNFTFQSFLCYNQETDMLNIINLRPQ